MFNPVFWGHGNIHVVFSIPGACGGRVVCRVADRTEAARLLWRFRSAQRFIRSTWYVRNGDPIGYPVPPAHVELYPMYGLRWLACRRPIICVRGSDVGGRRRSAFVTEARLWRPLPVGKWKPSPTQIALFA